MAKPNYLLLTLFILSFSVAVRSQNTEANKQLILRLDDIGMCHSANEGAEMIFKSGLPVSASVMFAGPWWREGVEILKKYPHVAVGIHLTLNSEWKNFKWGPILGREVPTLIDSFGYFHFQGTWLYKDIFSITEIEKELRAQIERGLASGLKIDYIDNHMGACTMTDKQRQLLEKLASDYKLGISGYFGESGVKGVDGYNEDKISELWISLAKLPSNRLTLMVSHPGMDSEEMNALFVEGTDGKPIGKDRGLVAKTLSANDFMLRLKALKISPVTYRDVISQKGIASMKRP
jgi:hypothetical protein